MSSNIIALAGNPNVGKSTVFNALTGLHQHTGNWVGKTVDLASGTFSYQKITYTIVDLPGTYSVFSDSGEENIAGEFLRQKHAQITVVVCDATNLEQGLKLVLQIQHLTSHVIVCLNLCDEAKKKGILVDTPSLMKQLQIPVVETSATTGKGIDLLRMIIHTMSSSSASFSKRETNKSPFPANVEEFLLRSEKIASSVVTVTNLDYHKRDRRIDRFVTARVSGTILMLFLLLGIFWITIVGANIPSSILSNLFDHGHVLLWQLADRLTIPTWFSAPLIDGAYRVLTWVVAVMLPPMAIFFPLFTLLEDLGYLPRVAFNLDCYFKRCKACGKQALTTCMGFGCNAVGVTGCRIIHSKRERLLAILTNAFVPCNGRFPALLTVISLFFLTAASGPWKSFLSASCLTIFVLLSLIMTFFVSVFLSKTVLKGETSAFFFELPPYRRPQIGKTLIHSLLDRTLFVLGRAVLVAAPAGLFIWLLANLSGPGEVSWLQFFASLLDPLGRWMGLDGVILLSFILGFPANEIVLPIALMTYLQTGTLVDTSSVTEMGSILMQNGWTQTTAICFLLFCLFHWPCSTTCLTIKKETGSWKWTGLAILLPTATGVLLCILVNLILHFF